MNTSYRLVLKSGPATGQTFPLEGPELIIGREPSCQISINDPEEDLYDRLVRYYREACMEGGLYQENFLYNLRRTFIMYHAMDIETNSRMAQDADFMESDLRTVEDIRAAIKTHDVLRAVDSILKQTYRTVVTVIKEYLKQERP